MAVCRGRRCRQAGPSEKFLTNCTSQATLCGMAKGTASTVAADARAFPPAQPGAGCAPCASILLQAWREALGPTVSKAGCPCVSPQGRECDTLLCLSCLCLQALRKTQGSLRHPVCFFVYLRTEVSLRCCRLSQGCRDRLPEPAHRSNLTFASLFALVKDLGAAPEHSLRHLPPPINMALASYQA